MTNADKIRAMTDEQLAVMCAGYIRIFGYIGPDMTTIYATNEDAADAWLEWLKRPAE